MNTLNNLEKLINLVKETNPELMDVEFIVDVAYPEDDVFISINQYNQLCLSNPINETDKQRFFLD